MTMDNENTKTDLISLLATAVGLCAIISFALIKHHQQETNKAIACYQAAEKNANITCEQ